MATNGFFGKLKAAFSGRKAPTVGKTGHVRSTNHKPTKAVSTARGRRTTTGAFGGKGTGRNLRGKPGVKLLKKTVKAGFKAQKRVVFGMSGSNGGVK